MHRMVLALTALTLTGVGCARNDAALTEPVVRAREEAPPVEPVARPAEAAPAAPVGGVREEGALWKAAFALDTRGPAAAEAETVLRQAGAEGYDVLARLARGAGEGEALQAAASEARCPGVFGFGGIPRGREQQSPSWYAARFAARLLAESPELRARAQGSAEAFDRQLALVASIPDAAGLLAAVARLEGESDVHVLSAAERALRCAGHGARTEAGQREALKAAERQVNARLTLARPEQGCDTAQGVTDSLVEKVARGTWRINGWSGGNDTLTVSLDVGGGGRMHLAPQCALALYDALARRGVYLSGLVMPLSTEGFLPKATREEAARRAVRDLGRFPEPERNRLAAQLVNAGHTVPLKVTVNEDTFGQDEELEAAVRQKQPQARELVDQHVFCRGTFGGSGIELLGYLDTRQAADTAYQLAQRCPRAVGAATAALVRLEDARALGLLEGALKDAGFSRKALERAIFEHYTPALDRALETLEAAGSSDAKALRQRRQAEAAPRG